jgi:hypothetical protein
MATVSTECALLSPAARHKGIQGKNPNLRHRLSRTHSHKLHKLRVDFLRTFPSLAELVKPDALARVIKNLQTDWDHAHEVIIQLNFALSSH